MEHFRRKKLIKNLHQLYLDNLKDSSEWTYSRTQKLVQCFNIVAAKMEINEVEEILHDIKQEEQKQLKLF